ncbi:hypothetical protein BBP40_001168 [Aspergillus hancockii]|nr:hypothetical protein BBP40_001168 [Aspergillus hancockii]
MPWLSVSGHSLLFYLTWLTIFFNVCAATECYFPKGNKASSHVPCQSGGGACCGEQAICLTNNLCLDVIQPFGLSRGSCTDIAWRHPNCTDKCQDVQESSSCSLVLYNNTNNNNEYCCNSIVNDPAGTFPKCDGGKPTFTVYNAQIKQGVALLANNQPSNSTSDRSSSGNNGTSHDVAIGAGVGVPLGVIALGSIVWAALERKKRLNALRSPQASHSAGNGFYAMPNTPGYQKAPERYSGQQQDPVELDNR